MWRSGALLFAAAAAVTVAGLALPHQPEVEETGLAAVAALGAAMALLLVVARERVPLAAYHAVIAFGTGLVCLGLLFNGERNGGPPGVDEMYYLWVVLYAAYYLDRAGTAAQAAIVVAAHGITLLAVDPGPIGVSRWISVAGLVCGTAFVVRLLSGRSDRLVADLGAAARTDPLTGLLNRRAFEEAFALEAARSQREGSGFALVLADLDEFKVLNDRLGHTAGDEALVQVGAILTGHLRDVDTVARFGGDEFALILPGTGRPGAEEVGERIARALCQDRELAWSLSLSFGVAEHGSDGATLDELVHSADAALYRSKRRRRPDRGRATATPVPAPQR